ncbi:uncharacterized protein B0H64DRAFT_419203 [Chaetomium fimeti]|uniref:DUF7514 domain-containing protein n=1 Tax=Chaetomium fimeti TaxID=1854472 RepID=A0AAE0HBF2_9PEZI|nr:hypothetical protein B0H64DRAFT_419203 [Chaetomium fimeti]
MASQTPNWVPWQGPAPPPPPAPAPFPVNRGSFPFPPSPHPTIHDAEDDDMTDGSYSDDESNSGSDQEEEDEPEEATPNVGRPREFVAPANAKPQGNHWVPPPGPPQPPGQGSPLDVLTEIRKMIKEELKQAPSPTPHEGNAIKDPASTGPSLRPRSARVSSSTSTERTAISSAAPWLPDPPKELSAIDRKWGVLFDKDDVPTKRWEQVMEEFMPQNTLVVTPGKMAAFYSHHKLELEAFPFTEIFRGRQGAPPARLAELYQQLGCEYYLVPAEPKARPTVPGLTPAGWARWMTLAMRAYPNEESQRLAMVVAALPINADTLFDIKPERLPKQISRHLLPERADRQSRVLLSSTLKNHLDATTQPPPRSPGKPLPEFIQLNPIEPDRERRIPRPPSPRSRYRPTGGIPSPPPSQAGDDDDDHPRRRPDRDRDHGGRERERERTYRDGAGRLRTYESNGSARRDPLPHLPPLHPANPAHPAHPSHPPLSSNRPPPPPAHRRHSMSGGVTVGGGRGHAERGYTWGPLPRSSSDSAMEARRERGDSRDGGREVRERERDHGREREREREMGRERHRDPRDRERDREREMDRERVREREARLRGRESGREQRERPRERRSASAAGFPERRGSGGSRKPPVVVKNGREKSSRDRNGGGGIFSTKNALTFCRVGLSLLDG